MQTLKSGITIGALCDNENSSERKFNDCLIEAIDEVLTSLGEPVKNSLYFNLRMKFNIEKAEIPQQIEQFSYVLHKIFGLGASRLEVKFMKNLQSKVKDNNECPEYEWSKWIIMEMSFSENVNNLRRNVENVSIIANTIS
jgi:hypothetical protein